MPTIEADPRDQSRAPSSHLHVVFRTGIFFICGVPTSMASHPDRDCVSLGELRLRPPRLDLLVARTDSFTKEAARARPNDPARF